MPAGSPGGGVLWSRCARLVDPVMADRSRPWLDLANPVELPAAGLDHANRADVVVVARDQHAVDSDGPGDDQGLPQDLGGVAAVPVGRKHTVADVPRLPPEEIVELMPDR